MKQIFLFAASLAIAFSTFAEVKTLSVGTDDFENYDAEMYDGSNWYNAPIIPTYNNSGTQILYTAEELAAMANSNISSLKFKFYAEDYSFEEYSSSLKVWLEEREEASFAKNADEKYLWFAIDTNNPMADFTYTENFSDYLYSGEPGYLEIDLSQNPFLYTGKNLVITFANSSERFVDGMAVCFYSYNPGSPSRLLTFTSDSMDFFANQEEDLVVNTTGGETSQSDLPIVEFTYEKSEGASVSGIGEAASSLVSGGKGTINLSLQKACHVVVANLAGQILENGVLAAGSRTMAVAKGLYLVSLDGKAHKICVY